MPKMALRPTYHPSPRPSWRTNRGRKVQDDISGMWCYEDETVVQDDGTRVYTGDRRTYDIRYDLDGPDGNPQ